ncbi:MAG TPA: metalloregulator ArsR/SmtB family transcription factor [Gaiellaceae bacterium]|nr:metalloregulator ArsR/SmtB family transcription factor [Gaiellaceae bacterium]
MPGVLALEADLFRALAHPSRLRLLELLGEGKLSVGELQALSGGESGTTSQHLSALRRQGLIAGHREGTSVIYRIKDARTRRMLRLAREIIRERLAEGQALLDELGHEPPNERRR